MRYMVEIGLAPITDHSDKKMNDAFVAHHLRNIAQDIDENGVDYQTVKQGRDDRDSPVAVFYGVDSTERFLADAPAS